jgi:hypothetical protein
MQIYRQPREITNIAPRTQTSKRQYKEFEHLTLRLYTNGFLDEFRFGKIKGKLSLRNMEMALGKYTVLMWIGFN